MSATELLGATEVAESGRRTNVLERTVANVRVGETAGELQIVHAEGLATIDLVTATTVATQVVKPVDRLNGGVLADAEDHDLTGGRRVIGKRQLVDVDRRVDNDGLRAGP